MHANTRFYHRHMNSANRNLLTAGALNAIIQQPCRAANLNKATLFEPT